MLISAFVESRAWTSSAITSRRTVLAKLFFRDFAYLLLIVFGSGVLASTALAAGPISDPANDFRVFNSGDPNSYAGPNNPGLDVLSANVILNLNLQTLTFTSTMSGPISGLIDPNTGANLGSFSWGINHGYGNNNFASICRCVRQRPDSGSADLVFGAATSARKRHRTVATSYRLDLQPVAAFLNPNRRLTFGIRQRSNCRFRSGCG